jgi:hypothetical protein
MASRVLVIHNPTRMDIRRLRATTLFNKILETNSNAPGTSILLLASSSLTHQVSILIRTQRRALVHLPVCVDRTSITYMKTCADLSNSLRPLSHKMIFLALSMAEHRSNVATRHSLVQVHPWSHKTSYPVLLMAEHRSSVEALLFRIWIRRSRLRTKVKMSIRHNGSGRLEPAAHTNLRAG